MTPDEESCFRNLMAAVGAALGAFNCVCDYPDSGGQCSHCSLLERANACTQATARAEEVREARRDECKRELHASLEEHDKAMEQVDVNAMELAARRRAAQTEAPEPPTEGLVSAMRTRIEAAGSRHLNKLSPPGVIPTTGQYIEALTVALAPVFVDQRSATHALTKHLINLGERLTKLDGEIGLFAARIHGQVTKLETRLDTLFAQFEGDALPEQPARFAPPEPKPVHTGIPKKCFVCLQVRPIPLGRAAGAPPVCYDCQAAEATKDQPEFTQQEVFDAADVKANEDETS